MASLNRVNVRAKTVETKRLSRNCRDRPTVESRKARISPTSGERREDRMRYTVSAEAGIAQNADRMLMFSFPKGIRIEGKLAGTITTSLRKAVMSRTPNPLPPEISGHEAEDRTHAAYLPLIEPEHSTTPGNIRGVAILCPPGKPGLVELLKKVLHTTAFRLEIPGATLRLKPQPSTTATEWTTPSRTWTTVTPIVLDRFPGKGNESAELARACRTAGLPEPTEIRTARSPFTTAATDLAPADLPRKTRLPYTHAHITFPDAIPGPVVLGSQRYLGMGLFRPAATTV